jgi:hypothetical protein
MAYAGRSPAWGGDIVLGLRVLRAARPSRWFGRSRRPTAGRRVRAVAHSDTGVRVTAWEAHRCFTNVVRLEPDRGRTAVDVWEARR